MLGVSIISRAEVPQSPAFQPLNVSEAALADYREGWIEILKFGRWSQAEALYRSALARSPEFLLAKSTLARITDSAQERRELYEWVEQQRQHALPSTNLLLHSYQQTLELFERRERGETMSDEQRRAMSARAVHDYAAFLALYPGEWSVMIEYIEWIHALDGPAAALVEVDQIKDRWGAETDFSYFPAYFHAELGDYDAAWVLAKAFREGIDDESSPQPNYLEAYLYFQQGDLAKATELIERALALDPRHLLASRLQRQILQVRHE